jgi:hypothetical protein
VQRRFLRACGTAAGTHEITVSGAASGQDAANFAGLWTTDGTAAGTHEITVSGAYSAGLYPYDLIVFNGEVLFGGSDNIPVGSSDGHVGMLWVYNGQTASEITGIAGALSGGLGLSDLTVFGHEVLFSGYPRKKSFLGLAAGFQALDTMRPIRRPCSCLFDRWV